MPENGYERPPVPRELAQRAHFMNQFLLHGSEPADPQQWGLLTDSLVAVRNFNQQSDPSSELQKTTVEWERNPDTFTMQSIASRIADTLFTGLPKPDMFDYMLAIRSATKLIYEGDSVRDQAMERRLNMFDPLCSELLLRVPLRNLKGEQDADLLELYRRTFRGVDSPSMQSITSKLHDRVRRRVRDHVTMDNVVREADWWLPSADKFPITPYNEPLTPDARQGINDDAGRIIEGLHLLKAYPVAPFITSAEQLSLPWDIAVMAPLDRTLERYQPGAVADFHFLYPNPSRTDVRLHGHAHEAETNITEIYVGEKGASSMRFRLFDNGQFAFGMRYEDYPSDIIEGLFAKLYAHDSFVRLRAVLCSLAFDAMVPEDVLREAGGSVASQMQRVLNEPRIPGGDLMRPIFLRRRRVLDRAKVGPKKRQPTQWEQPRREVGGYTRNLPEGTQRRPTAEDDAREYFTSINVAFNGLPPEKNFVRNYERGTGPLQVEFRRAHFLDNSQTAALLGRLGLSGQKK
jgi:hypothetical protein